MLTFARCEQLVSSARDRISKPVARNTRVERRTPDTYALRLHATDIATFHRDGRTTVNSGGWRTVTTKDRLRAFVTTALVQEDGQWYVQLEPDASDPEPPRGDRTVLKPFYALDPGPEPVKPAEGCIAGTESWREWDEEVLTSKRTAELPGTEPIVREYEGESDYWAGYRIVHRRELTVYVGDRGYHPQSDLPSVGINGTAKWATCPHCELFYKQHDAWESAMNGGGWGRERTHGYAKMVELLRDYGMIRKADEPAARRAWQEAYIADFRASREARKAHKEWVARNRVPFEDHMEITANGYAKRPNRKAIARAQKQQRTVERKRKRINKFVADAVKELTTNGVPMPSSGDCFGCQFRAEDRAIEPLGVDHLEQHIEERYYVPSMYVNAMRAAGYQDAGIYMLLGMDVDTQRMGGDRAHRISADSVTRALRRYLYDRLIPEISQHPVAA